jgi:hypothetical protein
MRGMMDDRIIGLLEGGEFLSNVFSFLVLISINPLIH